VKLRMALRALEWLLPCRDCGRLFCTKVDGWTFTATYKGRIRLCRRCYAMLFARPLTACNIRTCVVSPCRLYSG